MTSPWPGIVPGVDVSLPHKADLITAKGGAALERELERPRRRRPTAFSRWRIVPGKLPGATGPVKAWDAQGRPGRIWFPRP
jgi:hypothetical protein